MTLQHSSRERGNLDETNILLTAMEELQIKLNMANAFESLNGLPIIQARGRQMVEEVKQTVAELITGEPATVTEATAAAYGELDLLSADHADWLDEQVTKGYVMVVPYKAGENYHLTIKGMQKLIEQERK